MINVIWLCTPLGSRGGTFVHISHWAKDIDKSKYHITLVYSSDKEYVREGVEQLTEYGIEVINIPELREYKTLLLPAILKLIRLFKEKEVDILHNIFIQSEILGTISAIFARVPHVISSVEGKFNIYLSTRYKKFLYKIAYMLVKRRIEKIIAISDNTREEHYKDFCVDKDKIIVIRNGVEEDLFPWKRSLRIMEERIKNEMPVIGYYGQIIESKGVVRLIESFRDVIKASPKSKLLIIGEGRDLSRCKQIAERIGVGSSVEFIPWVENIIDIMLEFDILVFPSESEGIPWVILESLACAKPVIASGVGGITEVIRNGHTGIILKENTPEEITEATLYLINNLEVCSHIGRMGRILVEETFTAEREMREIENLYRSITRESKASG